MLPDKNSPALGRGLEALLGKPVSQITPTKGERGIVQIAVDMIEPCAFQPRRQFNQSELEELAQSIQQKGVLQPLLVRPKGVGYELIAGERRLRASKIASLKDVPVIVKHFDDAEVLEIALIENIQRKDLSAIEEALSFKRLMEEFKYTQEKISEIVGKSRSHIANTLRLLTLPESIQRMVEEGKLTPGHARTLINVNNAEDIAHKIIAGNLNVRQSENLRKYEEDVGAAASELQILQAQIQEAIRLKVMMRYKPGHGEVRIFFEDMADLDRFLEKIAV